MTWEPVITRWHFDDGTWRGSVMPLNESNKNCFHWFVQHKLRDIRAEGKEQTSKEALDAATDAYKRLSEAFK